MVRTMMPGYWHRFLPRAASRAVVSTVICIAETAQGGGKPKKDK